MGYFTESNHSRSCLADCIIAMLLLYMVKCKILGLIGGLYTDWWFNWSNLNISFHYVCLPVKKAYFAYSSDQCLKNISLIWFSPSIWAKKEQNKHGRENHNDNLRIAARPFWARKGRRQARVGLDPAEAAFVKRPLGGSLFHAARITNLGHRLIRKKPAYTPCSNCRPITVIYKSELANVIFVEVIDSFGSVYKMREDVWLAISDYLQYLCSPHGHRQIYSSSGPSFLTRVDTLFILCVLLKS